MKILAENLPLFSLLSCKASSSFSIRMKLFLLFCIAVSSYCLKFSSRWQQSALQIARKSHNYQAKTQSSSSRIFQSYSDNGNSSNSSSVPENAKSLAPLSDMNMYRNMLENDDSNSGVSISKDFIPTGPPALTQYDKKTTFKNSAIMNPKSETAKQYFDMVEKLSPNEMLQKFAETAPRNVQEATKSTIVNILGSLPNYALDAALITTSSKLANLLFQMQLTGYMFKNAEYRMSLTRSLKGFPRLPAPATISDGNTTVYLSQDGARVVGSVEVVTEGGEKVAVSADSLMQALSKEVYIYNINVLFLLLFNKYLKILII